MNTKEFIKKIRELSSNGFDINGALIIFTKDGQTGGNIIYSEAGEMFKIFEEAKFRLLQHKILREISAKQHIDQSYADKEKQKLRGNMYG